MAITAQQFINAIDGSGGSKTEIARRLRISRVHVYRLLKKYPTAQEVYDEQDGQTDDRLELTALNMALGERQVGIDGKPGEWIRSPHPALLIYLLKVRPGLRDKYGPEMKKLSISLSTDEIAMLPELVKSIERMGETVEDFFSYVIKREKQNSIELGSGNVD